MKRKVLIVLFAAFCCISGFSQDVKSSAETEQKKTFSFESVKNYFSEKKAEYAEKKARRKSLFAEYPQIIYNDAPFSVIVKLMDERTFLYTEISLPPQEVTVVNATLYKEGSSTSNRLLVSGNNIYIKTEKKLSDKSSVYILKPLRNRRSYSEDIYDEESSAAKKTVNAQESTNIVNKAVTVIPQENPAVKENSTVVENNSSEPATSSQSSETPDTAEVTETSENLTISTIIDGNPVEETETVPEPEVFSVEEAEAEVTEAVSDTDTATVENTESKESSETDLEETVEEVQFNEEASDSEEDSDDEDLYSQIFY